MVYRSGNPALNPQYFQGGVASERMTLDGTINKNGFPKGNVGDKFKVHLPKKYCEKGSNPVDAVVVDIPFTESYNPNTREVAK